LEIRIIIIYFCKDYNYRASEVSALPYVASRLRIALGTFVAVDAEATTACTAEQGITAAFEAIARTERVMHPRRAGSDVALLSACAPGTVLAVDAWTWDVLELCRELHRMSGGAFDPCLDSLPGRMSDVELVDALHVRTLAPVRIDLGGVAKGYAVDRAIEAMRAVGCDAGLVNAGGDLAVFGARSRKVLCSTSGLTSAFELKNAALATSDTTNLSRPAEHQGYYDGGDRARPISGAVSVTATRAALADALTKCLLVANNLSSQRLLDSFGARRVV
jgi:thiamine biosynthesis lipoprotein